jgi:hypothetical protein
MCIPYLREKRLHGRYTYCTEVGRWERGRDPTSPLQQPPASQKLAIIPVPPWMSKLHLSAQYRVLDISGLIASCAVRWQVLLAGVLWLTSWTWMWRGHLHSGCPSLLVHGRQSCLGWHPGLDGGLCLGQVRVVFVVAFMGALTFGLVFAFGLAPGFGWGFVFGPRLRWCAWSHSWGHSHSGWFSCLGWRPGLDGRKRSWSHSWGHLDSGWHSCLVHGRVCFMVVFGLVPAFGFGLARVRGCSWLHSWWVGLPGMVAFDEKMCNSVTHCHSTFSS